MAADDTEYSWSLPEGVMNIEFKLADAAVAFRWSSIQGVVAAGGGHPMSAGTGLADEGVCHRKQTLYFAHTGGALQTLKIAFNYPSVR